jgi:succinate dehydrogenase / fumarate reductase flavoprotein subunit/fumarate reductase flavoprotein subunit
VTGPGAVIAGAETIVTDVAVIGAGAAGLMAARHAALVDPRLRVTLVSKGLVGRSGCSIMVQGLNAALGERDDPEIHFRDMVRGGAYLADQRLAWAVATDAPLVVSELVEELGCTFDREADGRLALRPFAGQSVDRKVSHGHLTGLEIVSRLRDDLARSHPLVLADTRALDLLVDDAGVRGVVLLDTRRGVPIVLLSRTVVLASGGSIAGAYRVATPAREKAADGPAMALRAGLGLRDMEMVQFLSVGMVSGGSRLTGTLLEEALRLAGAQLLDASGDRFMGRYDPDRMERAPRDVVVRAAYAEIMAGRGTADGAVLLDCRPIGRADLTGRFGDLVDRARLIGIDLAMEPVQIAPAAHVGIGGLVVDEHGQTELSGLFAAGEDAGGTHGASWMGGNGIAESLVLGRRAGRRAAEVAPERAPSRLNPAISGSVEMILDRATAPLARPAPAAGRPEDSPAALTDELREILYERVGPIRDGAGLADAANRIEQLADRADHLRVGGGMAANGAWGEALDLESRLLVAAATVRSADRRTESRGVHARSDHPAQDDGRWLCAVIVLGSRVRALSVDERPVVLDRLAPDAGSAARS